MICAKRSQDSQENNSNGLSVAAATALLLNVAIAGKQPSSCGSADHRVSEMIYLADPEDNGVKVYADRPLEDWRWSDGQVKMGSYPLDVRVIMASQNPLSPA